MNTTEQSTGVYTRILAAVLGLWLLLRSVNSDSTGRTLIDYIIGNKATKSPYLSQPLSTATQVGSTVATTGTGKAKVNSAGQTNPFPGASGSRLDQGIDLTSKQFLSPFAGVVKVAISSDPGWAGGGYLAIQSLSNPKQVVYMAEGLTPTVRVGQRVAAGQIVATPRSNPYNGIVGNIEAGPANPSNPGQPLAQVASNPPAVVEQFYHWLLGLGGPHATSTSNAGYP